MEEEVRDILRNALKTKDAEDEGLGTRFARVGLDQDIPELRGQEVRPEIFDK